MPSCCGFRVLTDIAGEIETLETRNECKYGVALLSIHGLYAVGRRRGWLRLVFAITIDDTTLPVLSHVIVT
jgi:hypothetical protein